MKKSLISIVLACCFMSAQAEIMWHVAGTNLYARKQCLEQVKMYADSLTGVDYYFANIPQQIDATNLDSLYGMVFDRLAQTGATMPYGRGDIRMVDEGSTSFYRCVWNLNELPADGGFWIWNDVGVSDIQDCAWTTNNQIVGSTYLRLLYNIIIQNLYLQAAERLNMYQAEQAQVRFIRALTAWYLLDLFPTSHFTTQPIIDANVTMTRQELFAWLETELTELITLLPASQMSLYSVDADAAKMLLARLYLNAEVYTGIQKWSLASQYAQQVMDGRHALHTNGTSAYSPYQELFMGDNDINGAAREVLLMIKQDGQSAYSYGGSMFTIAITRDGNSMPSCCINDKWQCWRAGYRLLQAFATTAQMSSLKGTEYTMPAQLGDDRALFYADATYPTPTLSNNYGSFTKTWSVNKFTNRYSTDPMDGSACSASSMSWPDTDLPLMRSAEAWLTYAEAQYRMGNTQVARYTIASLRSRAHAETPADITLDYILDEWLREFYSEGRRRVDLVRFGQFASQSATRTWENHSARKNASYNTYPMPDLLSLYPRFDNKVRYNASFIPRASQEPWNPETGIRCDSCTEGEMYIDTQRGIAYSINYNNYGTGNFGIFEYVYELNASDTLNLELAEFPYMQYPAFTAPLPEVTPTDDAFIIMLHSETEYGNNLVVLGDYLNSAGEWIYSTNNTRPTTHATSGTGLNNQNFTRFTSVGNGWYRAVVYPITDKDGNPQTIVPGYARITGIANYPAGSSNNPQKVSPIQKVSGIVQYFTEKSDGSTEFSFSQLSYYEDPTYGRIYYSPKRTDRVVYLAIPAIR